MAGQVCGAGMVMAEEGGGDGADMARGLMTVTGWVCDDDFVRWKNMDKCSNGRLLYFCMR